MKCKVCNGELYFEKSHYVCANCNTIYEIDGVFENTEVSLLSVNYNEQNLKTKDAIIAKDIFSKLQSAKINVFYDAISADNIVGYDLGKLRISAIQHSSVVLLVGTTPENFSKLTKKYYDLIKEKTIIPILSDVNPTQLPKEINKFQAINYDSIGADKVLVKGIYALLGKESDLSFTQLQEKSNNKKTIIYSVAIAALIAILGFSAFWGYKYFCQNDVQENIPLTNQQKYENAQTLINENKYREAIDILTEIIDFKESKTFLKDIYDNFDGYFQCSETNAILHIRTDDINSILVSLTAKTDAGNIISFEETSILEGSTFTIQFEDNNLNKGTAYGEFQNEEIIISIENTGGESSFPSNKYVFKLSDLTKYNIPIDASLKEIEKWITNKTTIAEIRELGYTLERTEQRFWLAGNGDFIWARAYKIKDTNTSILFYSEEISNISAKAETLNYDFYYYFLDCNNNADEVWYATAAISTAEKIIPNEIGQPNVMIKDENLLFFPDVTGFEESFNIFKYKEDGNSENNITKNSYFGIVSKESIGDVAFNFHSQNIGKKRNKWIVAENIF